MGKCFGIIVTKGENEGNQHFLLLHDAFFSVTDEVELTLSLLTAITEAFVDSVDQDTTAQNVQSDLWSTPFTFSFLYHTWIVSSTWNGRVFFSQWITKFYSYVTKRQIFRLVHIQITCRWQNKSKWKIVIWFGKGRKHCGKRRKCWWPAFSPFPTMFSKGFFPRVVKSRDFVGKS